MTAGIEADLGLTLRTDPADSAARAAASRSQNRPIITPSFSFTNTQGLAGFSPQIWGPNTGYWWAVQRITIAGLTAAVAAVPGTADGNVSTIAAATAGNVSLPHATDSLTGFQISLSTVGSAAMTVTVSNVSGGPYIYTILTGGSSLSITYPQPIPSTGTAPQVAWSATSAAVGNVSIYGLTAATAAVAQDALTVYRGQSPSEVQPQNAIETLLGNNGYSQSIHLGGEGVILHPQDGIIFQGTALAAATYYVNVDVLQVTDNRVYRISPGSE